VAARRGSHPRDLLHRSYHEREAVSLARQCGVAGILVKPSDPEVIIAKVDAVLERSSKAPGRAPSSRFEADHLQIVTDKLAEKVHELEASEHRLTAVINACRGSPVRRIPSRWCATSARPRGT
jgi:DNA-binding response OmpR family regulator